MTDFPFALAACSLLSIAAFGCGSEGKTEDSGLMENRGRPQESASSSGSPSDPACNQPAPKDSAWVGGAGNLSQPYCPSSCSGALQGMQLDETKSCRRMVVLGCRESFGGTTDAPCFRSPDDGRLVETSSTIGTELGFVRCTEDEAKRMHVDPCE